MSLEELHSTESKGANEGDLLWMPSEKKIEESGLAKFTLFAEKRIGRNFANYQELWEWSVSDIAGFMSSPALSPMLQV